MPNISQPPPSYSIVLFDGVCNLCDACVHFIIRRDPKKQFHFASIQSDIGQGLLVKFGLPTDALHTMLVFEGESYYTKSAAVLKLIAKFNGLWPLLGVLVVVPKPLSDALYDWVAKNRYRWFGGKVACAMPTEDLNDRFLV